MGVFFKLIGNFWKFLDTISKLFLKSIILRMKLCVTYTIIGGSGCFDN